MLSTLGLDPWSWLSLSAILGASIFFSFRRPWSLRNFDLAALSLLTPPLLGLADSNLGGNLFWFVWLWVLGALWVIRSLIDLGLPRRPLLEANLSVRGLSCLAFGLVGLMTLEIATSPTSRFLQTGQTTVPYSLVNRPPYDTGMNGPFALFQPQIDESLDLVELIDPLLATDAFWRRLLSALFLPLIFIGLIAVGVRHFGRYTSGLSAAGLLLLVPAIRMEIAQSGLLMGAGFSLLALLWFDRPLRAGLAIGIAAGWQPACLGLLPLWFGFYRGRQAVWFLSVSVLTCAWIASLLLLPTVGIWLRRIGGESLIDAGLLPGIQPNRVTGIWSHFDPVYRIPVIVAYIILVTVVSIWPLRKNLGEMIALSTALITASQFWYPDQSKILFLIALPSLLLMIFRPNLILKEAPRLNDPSKPIRERFSEATT